MFLFSFYSLLHVIFTVICCKWLVCCLTGFYQPKRDDDDDYTQEDWATCGRLWSPGPFLTVGHLIEPANTDKWTRSVLSDPLSKVYRENDMTDSFWDAMSASQRNKRSLFKELPKKKAKSFCY